MKTIQSFDPSTGQAFDTPYMETSVERVHRISQDADEAASQLRSLAPDQRARLLEAMGVALEDQRVDLVRIADQESAIGEDRLSGELNRTINQLRHLADVVRDGLCFEASIEHADGSKKPPTPDLRRVLDSVGPVAVFGASNFPFAFSAAGGDTASALAAGSPVVIKVHSSHPRLDTEVAQILQRTCVSFGLEPGTIGWVYGREAGRRLVQEPAIQAVGFTGSETAGRSLMDLAAARDRPIPVYAEMGSLNPLVISRGTVESTRANEVSKGLADSVSLGHGQLCTKPGIVFVPNGQMGDSFVEQLREELTAKEAQHMLSRNTRDSFIDNVKQIHGTVGVLQLASPEPEDMDGSLSRAGLAQTTADNLIASKNLLQECFGPATLVVRYATTSELYDALLTVPPALTGTVHAEENEIDFIRDLGNILTRRTGRVLFNDFPTGVAVTWSQHHGGPYPASSSALHSSVGGSSIRRFLKPNAFQNWPNELLPTLLQDANPARIPVRINGNLISGGGNGETV